MNTAGQIGGIISSFLDPIIHSPVVETSVRLAAWGLVILWVATVLWAFRDAMARTHNPIVVLGAPAVVFVATPLGFPLAVLVWRILRPQHTAAEEREQRLTIDALRASSRPHTCPTCRATVNAEWRRCPWCRTWLMAACPRCERLVELSAVVCPWCVLDLMPGSLVPHEAVPAMVPVMATSGAMVPVMDPGAFEPAGATRAFAQVTAELATAPVAADDTATSVAAEPATAPVAAEHTATPAHVLAEPARLAAEPVAPPPAPEPVIERAARRLEGGLRASRGGRPSGRGHETPRTREESAPSTALW